MGREGVEPSSQRVKGAALPVELPTREKRRGGWGLPRSSVGSGGGGWHIRRRTGIEPVTDWITTSQSHQRLPLRSAPDGIRTRVSASTGRPPGPLADGGVAPKDGFEPPTHAVTGRRSAAELLRNVTSREEAPSTASALSRGPEVTPLYSYGPGRPRTDYPLLAKQALSLVSYRPVKVRRVGIEPTALSL